MSDDFDARKFPDLIEKVKTRRRAQSLDSTESADAAESDGAPVKVIRYLRRLSSGAITPSDTQPRSLVIIQHPPLTEANEEEMDTSQDSQ